jgi:predicted nucleic acid-binding Zn ribbon protein
MPVAVARKIEFRLYQEGLDGGALDIQVRPIVLTHDQCIRYRLPRTPIKDTETRAAAFEARFGEGATELDALEALHPGELERILTREIGRYYDADLDDRIEEVAAEVETDIEAINAAVAKKNAKAIATLKAEHKKLAAAVKAYEKKAKPILRKIEKDLEAEAPDAESYDWPEPNEGDEDDDPLFDSTREYLEQVDRYKEHQGKPTESTRKPYDFYPAKCACCGKAFKAASRNTANACSGACREQLRRDKASAAKPLTPCVTCGALFNSIRGAETCSDKCRKKLRRKAVRS